MNATKCSICHKPIVKSFSPFCSTYCKNIDLLKWLNEDYKVSAQVEEKVNLPQEGIEED